MSFLISCQSTSRNVASEVTNQGERPSLDQAIERIEKNSMNMNKLAQAVLCAENEFHCPMVPSGRPQLVTTKDAYSKKRDNEYRASMMIIRFALKSETSFSEREISRMKEALNTLEDKRKQIRKQNF